MRHKSEMYDAVLWMLIGMGVMLFFACANSESSSGAGQSLPHEIIQARDLIRPHYKEAAAMPVVIRTGDYWAEWRGTRAAYSPKYVETFNGEPWQRIDFACSLVHEYTHSQQIDTKVKTDWRFIAEREAYEQQAQCAEKLNAPDWLSEWYRNRDGKHRS